MLVDNLAFDFMQLKLVELISGLCGKNFTIHATRIQAQKW